MSTEGTNALPTAVGGAAAAAQLGLWEEAADKFRHPRSIASADYADGRGVLSVGGDMFTLDLTSGTPVPSGSDITNQAGGAIVGGDLDIRDTAFHDLVIPMAGFRRLWIGAFVGTGFSQALTFSVFGNGVGAGGGGFVATAQLLQATVPASTALNWAVGGGGAVGQGGIAGGATVAVNAFYAVPALDAAHPFVVVELHAGVAPVSGTLRLIITRSRA